MYLCADQASHVVAGRVEINIDGIWRLRTPFVRTAEGKGRFRTLPVCAVKSRKFESFHSGNATKRSRGCIISCRFVAIIISWWFYVCAELYNITRRGLACVAYPWKEAMREPDCRDRRGGTNSHVFFISSN